MVFEDIFVNFGEIDVSSFKVYDIDNFGVDGFFFVEKLDVWVDLGGATQVFFE